MLILELIAAVGLRQALLLYGVNPADIPPEK